MDFKIEQVIDRLIESDGREFLTGGASSETVVFDQVEVCKPVYTRDTCSLYEYVLVLTTLAKTLHDSSEIAKYIDLVDVNTLINPALLAFILISSGKMNAILFRNYRGYGACEKVSLSELVINPEWESRIREYYAEKEMSMYEELYKHIALEGKI